MSADEFELSARFEGANAAETVASLLQRGRAHLLESGEDSHLGAFLERQGAGHGIDWDSWWVPAQVRRDGEVLHLSLVGSPSGTREQDIVTWLRRAGAREVAGRLAVDTGADVEELVI